MWKFFDNLLRFSFRSKYSINLFLVTNFNFESFRLLKLLNIHSVNAEIRDYFTEVVKTTIRYRETENVRRNDILQLLIDLQKEDPDMSVEEVAGNAYIFFFAGAETSTSIAFYCLFELCRHPELWKKAQKEVDEVLSRNNGEFNYEVVQDVKYIDSCIKGKFSTISIL